MILEQVRRALDSQARSQIDWITFVGSGEPTLHSGLGYMISQVKKISHIPIAVITNGALLFQPEVREDLIQADAVLPSLDAGNPQLYRHINRPHPLVPFESLVSGLKAFRLDYPGKLWIEVMMVKGLNDTERELREIRAILDQLGPDEIHINQPVRPPAEPWVQPTDESGLLRARAILGENARWFPLAEGGFNLGEFEDVVDAILAVITRHPMRQEELVNALAGWEPEQINQALGRLESSGRAQVVARYGLKFWSAQEAYYPES
jgi:wyosine [tRNA(Phe)-imidazoG37] synthetase (radical SAM superfamily)